MSRVLVRATNYMRDEQETLRRVKGALTYPGIMLAFAITTTIFLLAFVLPKFTVIYASKGAALPMPNWMPPPAFQPTNRPSTTSPNNAAAFVNVKEF